METIYDIYREALRYHAEPRAGKIGIVPTKPFRSERDFTLAYSPGVAAPVEAIAADPVEVYRYTNKGNAVAILTNGTAVLGLGNAGPLAAKPVMEGKSMSLKVFADVDGFDIELDAEGVDEFVAAARAVAPGFGAILLEDIKAPECFEIEERLQAELPIPVMHDDRHGTAVVVAAAVKNGALLTGRRLERMEVVIAGAGAAATGCAQLFVRMGIRRERIVMCDSRGVVRADRDDLTPQKREFATSRNVSTLAEAMRGADLFVGLSAGGTVNGAMIESMAADPMIFALANPVPEISYEETVAVRPDALTATGRGDYPNQVNNVLAFPYLFRGALDVRAARIDFGMQLAAADALARLAREEVPSSVLRAGLMENLAFGRGYLIPKPYDPRLRTEVTAAVSRAALRSGAAVRVVEPAME